MLDNSVIQPSQSPFTSSSFLVKKKDGTWNFYVDYRQLNAITMKKKFPIPIIDDLLDELHRASVFSMLNLRSRYHQIRMNPAEVYKTTFITHLGHYEFKGKDMDSYVEHLSQTLLMLRQHNLFVNMSKCSFPQGQIEYLHHMVSNVGVSTASDKVKAMLDWPQPVSVRELRGFLDLTGYYRKFILSCPY
ncbi:Transposon Ty3-G Gag-Pol polyprotein-like protein [Drosera capensis]